MPLKAILNKYFGITMQNDEDSARERLKLVSELSNIGSWDFNFKTRLTHRDLNHDRIFGYQKLLPRWSDEDAFRHLLPEYHDQVFAAFEESKRTGILEYEAQILRADGEIRWIYIKGITKKNIFKKDNRLLGIIKDITAEKDLEEKFELQRKNITDLFEEAPQFFCLIEGESLTYTYVNPAHIELFNGRSMKGLRIEEAQPELTGTPFPLILKNLFKSPQNIIFKEVPIQIGDRHRYLDMIYSPRKNAKGEVDGIYALGTDVTEKVLALKQAKLSESHIRLITDKIPAFISYTDPQGRYRFMNAMYEDWFRKPISEMLGKTRQEIAPEDYYINSRPYEDKALSGAAVHHESSIIKPDGRRIDLDIHFVPDIDSDTKEVRGMIAIGMDITAQKKALLEAELARQNLHEVLMQAPAPMCLLSGEDHVFILANPLYEELIGRSVLGKSLKEVFHEDIELYETILDHVYTTGRPYFIREAPLDLCKDGRVGRIYMNVGYHAYKDVDGNMTGVLVIIQEVTDQVNSVKARDSFMGIASHELKTPLTALKLQMQMNQKMLEMDGPTPFTKERLSRIFTSTTSQVNRLTRLVDDMLDMTRVSAEKLHMTFSDVNFSRLVVETMDSFLLQFKNVGVDVELEIQDEVELKLDEARMEQVLSNLITNVIKYAPGRPLKVDLYQGENEAILRVKDHGPGIDSKYHDKIFERFERISTGRDVSGMGLGLFITRKIVESHGGSISVESEIGQGTEFKITLPLELAPSRDRMS